MNVDVLKLFEQLKLWTSLLQLLVAKALTFDGPQFTCDLFFFERKRHVNTTPVNLFYLKNSKHSSHVGAMFAYSTIGHL